MSSYSGYQLSSMSIHEVVNLPGGNGLASPAFHAPLNFLGIFGWHHVENGVEVLLCDGQEVTKTYFTTDWLHAIGRRTFLRRVLMQPPPLTDVKAKALTNDQLQLTLELSVKYNVLDAQYVAAVQDPLSELRDTVIGCASELIRAMPFNTIVSDTGMIRNRLKLMLDSEPSIRGHFSIVQILKAIPTGDERLIEVARQTTIEQGKQGLVTAEGENKLIGAQYQEQIDRQQAQLAEERANLQHARDMESDQMRLIAETQQVFFKTLGEVAKGGIDPSVLLESASKIPQMMNPPQQTSTPNRALTGTTTTQQSTTVNIVEEERIELQMLQEAGQIETFNILSSGEKFNGAIVQTKKYEIIFTCSDTYPNAPPDVVVRYQDGRKMTPNLTWIPRINASIAKAVVTVMLQADIEQDSSSSATQGFRLNLDGIKGEEQ